MAAGKLAATSIAILLLATAAWWMWSRVDAPPPGASPPNVDARGTAAIATTAEPERPADATEVADAPTREIVAASADPTTAPPTASIFGRCVDENGVPLGGCDLHLRSATATDVLDAWLLDHPAPHQVDQHTRSADDGRFLLTFSTLPPLRFQFDVRAPGRVGVGTWWDAIAAGAALDLGDVVLAPGVQLTGIVVDEHGAPRPDVELRAATDRRPVAQQGRLGWTQGDGRTDAQGRFVFSVPLPPGPYRLRAIGGPETIALGAVELPSHERLVDVRLVMPRAAARPTITGRVVDAEGRPVHNAIVRSAPERSVRTTTEADGTFRLASRDEEAAPVDLRVEKDGYVTQVSPTSIPWGTDDVTFVLQAGPELRIRVTDAHDQPVTQFSLRLLAADRRHGLRGFRTRGPFADGTATLRLTPGSHRLVLEFATSTGLLPWWTSIEVGETPLHLDLRMQPPEARRVRVQTAEGRPIAGSRVLACEAFDGTVDARTHILPLTGVLETFAGTRAVLVDEGTTDRDGSVSLRGPVGRAVHVVALGPGHVPHVVAEPSWQTTPLDVVVTRGGTVRGRVQPPEVIGEWRRLQQLDDDLPFEADRRPILMLRRGGETLPAPQDTARFAIDDEGNFAVDGVPPGRWSTALRYWTKLENGESTSLCEGPEIQVDEGATTEFELDLTELLPGTLVATVTHNGEPLAYTAVALRFTDLQPGERPVRWASARTDGDGTFVHVGPAGEYRIECRSDPNTATLRLRSTSGAVVRRGQTTRHAFELWSGTLELTLRDTNGAPAAGVRLLLDDDPGAPWPTELPATDANGVVTVTVSAGTVRLLVLPRRLQSKPPHERLAATRDELREARLLLDTVTVPAGAPTRVVLNLPAAWHD